MLRENKINTYLEILETDTIKQREANEKWECCTLKEQEYLSVPSFASQISWKIETAKNTLL